MSEEAEEIVEVKDLRIGDVLVAAHAPDMITQPRREWDYAYRVTNDPARRNSVWTVLLLKLVDGEPVGPVIPYQTGVKLYVQRAKKQPTIQPGALLDILKAADQAVLGEHPITRAMLRQSAMLRVNYRDILTGDIVARITTHLHVPTNVVRTKLSVSVDVREDIVTSEVSVYATASYGDAGATLQVDGKEPPVKRPKLVDGLTPDQCLDLYTKQQREGGKPILTRLQLITARALWTHDVSVKVRASEAEAARREHDRIVVDDDRWEVD